MDEPQVVILVSHCHSNQH